MIRKFKIGELTKFKFKKATCSTYASSSDCDSVSVNNDQSKLSDKLLPNKYIQSEKEMEIHAEIDKKIDLSKPLVP